MGLAALQLSPQRFAVNKGRIHAIAFPTGKEISCFFPDEISGKDRLVPSLEQVWRHSLAEKMGIPGRTIRGAPPSPKSR